jgi:hypothetical protein
VPVEFSINPLTRETDGVFGDSRNPLETPRAVSTITAGQDNERAIDGLRELLENRPGAYAPSSYGELTVSYLRGDVAEAYLNGQRRSDNFYGYLPSFNGVEAVDVVRGPGSVVFGAGYLTGGYVNYVTKQPKFSAPETNVTTRFGTWVPGGLSYGNASVQFDTTAPVNDRLDAVERRQIAVEIVAAPLAVDVGLGHIAAQVRHRELAIARRRVGAGAVLEDLAQAVDRALVDQAGGDRAHGAGCFERVARVAEDAVGFAGERVDGKLDRHVGHDEAFELVDLAAGRGWRGGGLRARWC